MSCFASSNCQYKVPTKLSLHGQPFYHMLHKGSKEENLKVLTGLQTFKFNRFENRKQVVKIV